MCGVFAMDAEPHSVLDPVQLLIERQDVVRQGVDVWDVCDGAIGSNAKASLLYPFRPPKRRIVPITCENAIDKSSRT